MDVYAYTDNAILQQIGLKLKEERVAKNISQAALAEACGLSQFSISQIENGHNTSLGSIIMILRALNKLEVLEGLFAERPVSPIALSQMQKKERVKKHVYKRSNVDARPTGTGACQSKNANDNVFFTNDKASIAGADFNWDEQ